MKIKTDDLRLVTEKIFKHIYDLKIENFEVEDDYYWEIPNEDALLLKQEPTKHIVGQLSDDWEGLRKILEEDSGPLIYDFVNLASIFRYIGQKYTG